MNAKLKIRYLCAHFFKKNLAKWWCAQPKTAKILDTHKITSLNFFQNFFFWKFHFHCLIKNLPFGKNLYDNFNILAYFSRNLFVKNRLFPITLTYNNTTCFSGSNIGTRKNDIFLVLIYSTRIWNGFVMFDHGYRFTG